VLRRLVVAGVLVALAACGGSAPRLSDCYTGTGVADGQKLSAKLQLRLVEDTVVGTYVISRGPVGVGIHYDVYGALEGDRFDGTFTIGELSSPVKGTMQRDEVTFDNSIEINWLTAGC
jgi:hypothetical protein